MSLPDAPPPPSAPPGEGPPLAALGLQWLIECHDADPRALDDREVLEAALVQAARAAGATVLGAHMHRFAPQGVSGVVVLAESHLTVHTWPEHRYAAFDLFSCSERILVGPALDELGRALKAGEVTASAALRRGVLGVRGVARALGAPWAEARLVPLREQFDAQRGGGLLVAIDAWGCPGRALERAGAEGAMRAVVEAAGLGAASRVWSWGDERDAGWVAVEGGRGALTARLDAGRGVAHVELRSTAFFDPARAAAAVVDAVGARAHTVTSVVRR